MTCTPLAQTLPTGKNRFGLHLRGITRKSGSAITRDLGNEFPRIDPKKVDLPPHPQKTRCRNLQ